MVWLPDGEKICATHERDGQTDGRTDRHRVTAYTALMHTYASRGKNRHFYVPRPSIFVCPGDVPAAITQNVAWIKIQFSACQTPRSMYPSIFNSFPVIRTASANKKLSYRWQTARAGL